MKISIFLVTLIFSVLCLKGIPKGQDDPESVFMNPPESARPGVLWMWMGSNLTKEGITKDLETLKEAGFNRTTMFHLSDATTSLPAEIANRPGPEIISWTEPWWEMVRFAAEESKRLGMEFGMFNCPGYETSGGKWITPELSMQDLCWSEQPVSGNPAEKIVLEKPDPDPHSRHPFPHYNRKTGEEWIPLIPERKTYYKDIAVLAVPAEGAVSDDDVIELTGKMLSDGTLNWAVPEGKWTIFRFGHTTNGAWIFPAQWQATGLEADKMNREAMAFHLDHVIVEIKKHLGDLAGTTFTHVHFDSYEASIPNWTPKMREEFKERRGYDIAPWLLTFAGKQVGSRKDSLKFVNDFEMTIKDLYRDVYFKMISEKLADAGLTFLCEPYGGPWNNDEIMPYVHKVMTEFWTDDGVFTPYELEPTVVALRKAGKNLIEAEAFTGRPAHSRWTEYPAWLKPIGDEAFCEGVNRFIVHRFVQQPFDEKYKPGLTMGLWGTHLDRTQTWWKPAKAMFHYWHRCQGLLQWGDFVEEDYEFIVTNVTGNPDISHIHRRNGETDIFFVANLSHKPGTATCSFLITGMQPELWDPVTGEMRDLPRYEDSGRITSIPMEFDDAQSFFIVFRKKADHKSKPDASNFPLLSEAGTVEGPWEVTFDTAWGGPSETVKFDNLVDWTTRMEDGIKYYSGTAIYRNSFDRPGNWDEGQSLFLDLGTVKHIARIKLNGRDLGVVWTAPWRVELPGKGLKEKDNKLEIEITNVWANRLIGDEQHPADAEWAPAYSGAASYGHWMAKFPEWFVKDQPRPSKGRYCFTTWNYFTEDSSLVPSGLLGPVRLFTR